ncbi:MAG: insulinase family protein [Holosporales bacterium]|jgi:predicted Zn-dependent peptidase|nr:insulinase family protein [Holosporales bacterium]
MSVEKTVLKNGITVASDKIENFETVSVGIFVNVGSVNETEELCGVSHFVEHMAFKGTEQRTAFEISEAIESVGGYMNAYTGKEITAYYVKVLKNNLRLAVDVVTDIIQNSIFNSVEFEKERGVIIQEIKQMNDTPDDLAFELFQKKSFENEELGRPILGTIESVRSFNPKDLRNYLKNNYKTSSMVLAASGNVDHDELTEISQNFTEKMTDFETKPPKKQLYKGGFAHKEKDLEQKHIMIGFEGANHNGGDKFDQMVFSTIIGGGMSSRLFQEVREKRGLVYSIYSYNANYKDTGTFGIYAGSDNANSLEVAKIIHNELMTIQDNVKEEEIERAKTQIKAAFLMGLESSSTRMERMAHQYLLFGRFFSCQETTDFINSVNIDSVKNCIKKIISSKPTVTIVGRGSEVDDVFKVFSAHTLF